MPKLSENLEFNYVLCAVESRVWTGAITDSNTSHEVTNRKQADADAGRFVKVLVKSSALANVRNSVNKARALLYSQSVPWLSSSHLVKVDRMGDINAMIEKQREAFNAAVERFLEDYPTLVQGAEKRLGELFSAGDYPTVEALRGKFSFSVTWLPFTKAAPEQLAAMDGAAAKLVENSVAAAIERGKREAHAEILNRTIEAVDGVNGALSRYEEMKADGKKAMLHESRIESLYAAADDICDYSFPETGADAIKLEETAELIREVAAEGVDTFKESESARRAAQLRLDSIRARLESLQF